MSKLFPRLISLMCNAWENAMNEKITSSAYDCDEAAAY